MNTTLEVLQSEKGSQAEIQGQVTYSMEPRQWGKAITQFVVVQDDTGKVGCNIGLDSKEDKLENGANVHIKGVVDKYPDKKNPNPDGSLPIATSIKGYVVEETITDADFPYGANVKESEHATLGKAVADEEIRQMEKAEEKARVLPAKTERKPVELRNPQQPIQKNMTQQDYWREKTFRDIDNNKKIVRECAVKAATEIEVAQITKGETLAVDGYLKLADIIVDYINKDVEKEEKEEERITDRDLILSGAKTKAEIIAYINNVRVGTPYENDAEFYVGLGCQILTHQKKEELIETVEKFEELLGGQ